jgi:hypothetical protein
MGRTMSPRKVDIPSFALGSFGYPPASAAGARTDLLEKKIGSVTPLDHRYLSYGSRGLVVPKRAARPANKIRSLSRTHRCR